MATLMPRDDDLVPIPALRLRPGGAHQLAVGAVSATTVQPFPPGTRVISVFATGPVFLRTGTAGVTASPTDHFIPPNTYLDLSLGNPHTEVHTHVAAIRASTDCTLYISERE